MAIKKYMVPGVPSRSAKRNRIKRIPIDLRSVDWNSFFIEPLPLPFLPQNDKIVQEKQVELL